MKKILIKVFMSALLLANMKDAGAIRHYGGIQNFYMQNLIRSTAVTKPTSPGNTFF